MGLHKHLCLPINLVYAMHEYYCAGHSVRETAKQFGVSPHGVHNSFKRHGLYIRNTSHALFVHNNLSDEIKAMYRDYQAGMSQREIGRKYHLSKSAVYRRFKARNLPARPSNRRIA